MPATVVIRLDQGALDKLLRSSEGPVGRMIYRATLRVHALSKRLCPVDTGRLRASILWAMAREGGELEGMVYTDVSYALFVELGTWHMAARSYLRAALQAARL
jgi:hypothetical protein